MAGDKLPWNKGQTGQGATRSTIHGDSATAEQLKSSSAQIHAGIQPVDETTVIKPSGHRQTKFRVFNANALITAEYAL